MSNTAWIIILSIIVILIFTILTIIRASKRGAEMDWAMLKFWESKTKDGGKTNPKPNSKPWIGSTLIWILVTFLVFWFVWPNRFSFMSKNSDQDEVTSKMKVYEKVIPTNGKRFLLDRFYIHHWTAEEDIVFKSYDRPDGNVVDTLYAHSKDGKQWSSNNHNGWHKWTLYPTKSKKTTVKYTLEAKY